MPEVGGKLRENQRITGATAGNNELVNFCFGQNETIQASTTESAVKIVAARMRSLAWRDSVGRGEEFFT